MKVGWSDRGQEVPGRNFSRRTERRLVPMTPQIAIEKLSEILGVKIP